MAPCRFARQLAASDHQKISHSMQRAHVLDSVELYRVLQCRANALLLNDRTSAGHTVKVRGSCSQPCLALPDGAPGGGNEFLESGRRCELLIFEFRVRQVEDKAGRQGVKMERKKANPTWKGLDALEERCMPHQSYWLPRDGDSPASCIKQQHHWGLLLLILRPACTWATLCLGLM